MHISIIIPTLNEARLIGQTLAALEGQAAPYDVIVADGGSTDGTLDLVADRAQVVASERGRAIQMNTGAARATGEVLLFLHADTLLPPDALASIRRSLARDGESGIFRLRFDRSSPLLRFYSYCTRFNFSRFCFGDRALFVKQSVFEEVGGFPAIPIFEDLELVKRLHSRGTFTFLEDPVITAARRFDANGPLRQQFLNSYLWMRYQLGESPWELARYYAYETASRTGRVAKKSE